MDEGITFRDCEVREVSGEIKKLFPEDNLVEVIEEGKSYILSTNYIILLF
ncbi:hypothetical protein ACERC8_01545 [Streptococcus sp. E29BA]